MKPTPVLHLCEAIVDAAGNQAVGGAAVLLHQGSLLAAGPRAQVEQHPRAASAQRCEHPDRLLLPALVNAHAHLDLSHIGPQPYDKGRGFTAWADRVRTSRADDEPGIAAAVQTGIELAKRGGTGIIGDIAGVGSRTPFMVMRAAGFPGVSFIELFGQGDNQLAAIHFLNELAAEARAHPPDSPTRLGLQPHAPYSAGPALYAFASASGLPVSTHLAETLEERRFVEQGDGPFRDLIKSLRKWHEAILEGDDAVGRGRHPIEHTLAHFPPAPWLAAHVNDLGEGAARAARLRLLAETNTSVAYCPRANAYFRREEDFGPHAYRDMLAADINVALGTDSLLCLPEAEADRLSILDEMRYLYERDHTDPMLLLTMATTNGARALRFDPDYTTFTPGPIAGVIALPATPGDPAPLVNRPRRQRPPRPNPPLKPPMASARIGFLPPKAADGIRADSLPRPWGVEDPPWREGRGEGFPPGYRPTPQVHGFQSVGSLPMRSRHPNSPIPTSPIPQFPPNPSDSRSPPLRSRVV